jgi:hypothetical protein
VAKKLIGSLSAHAQQFIWLDLALTGICARGAAALLQAIRDCERLDEGLFLDLQVIGELRFAETDLRPTPIALPFFPLSP